MCVFLLTRENTVIFLACKNCYRRNDWGYPHVPGKFVEIWEGVKPLYYDLIKSHSDKLPGKKKSVFLCRTGLVNIGGELLNIRKTDMDDEI